MIENLKLMPDNVSPDIVAALAQLLDEAKKGDVIGLGFIAVYKRREYIVNVAGELRRNPTLARGMVASLDDYLAAQPHK